MMLKPSLKKNKRRLDPNLLTYQQTHRKLGSASDHMCVCCGEPAQEWAFDNQEPYYVRHDRVSRKTKYYPDTDRYKPMCRSCHKKLDFGDYCNRGHIRSENTATDNRGKHYCRLCRNEDSRASKKRVREREKAEALV